MAPRGRAPPTEKQCRTLANLAPRRSTSQLSTTAVSCLYPLHSILPLGSPAAVLRTPNVRVQKKRESSKRKTGDKLMQKKLLLRMGTKKEQMEEKKQKEFKQPDSVLRPLSQAPATS